MVEFSIDREDIPRKVGVEATNEQPARESFLHGSFDCYMNARIPRLGWEIHRLIHEKSDSEAALMIQKSTDSDGWIKQSRGALDMSSTYIDFLFRKNPGSISEGNFGKLIKQA